MGEEVVTQRQLPYPRSESIAGLEWLAPAVKYPGSGTDMHWQAWGADGALYVVDDDGENFGLPWNFAHLLRATGTPPDIHLEEISAFPELIRPPSARYRRYVDGALAVGDRLYVAAYDYDDDEATGKPFWFLDAVSRHGGVAALMYSDDSGRTFHNVPDPDAETDYFLGPHFAGLAFVGFGPGYAGVPARFGDYVYAISNDINWESGDNVRLARVPRDRVLDRAAWEFYAAAGAGRTAAEPVWSRHEAEATPILSDAGHVGHPTMTYDPGLGRFLLTFGSDEVPHTFETPEAVVKETWHRHRELCLYEGPTPWGPWGLVHYDPFWEVKRVAYLPQIPPNWLSADGREGWLLFSGDYGSYDDPSRRDFYGFMMRPFRLKLAGA
ncbi:MAG: DUF4185 domain-containing protein [Thermomicrobiales bacterium]